MTLPMVFFKISKLSPERKRFRFFSGKWVWKCFVCIRKFHTNEINTYGLFLLSTKERPIAYFYGNQREDDGAKQHKIVGYTCFTNVSSKQDSLLSEPIFMTKIVLQQVGWSTLNNHSIVLFGKVCVCSK
jgi:hypothetical protein